MSMFATMAGFYLFVKKPDKQGKDYVRSVGGARRRALMANSRIAQAQRGHL